MSAPNQMKTISRLMERGVVVHEPETVSISGDIDIEKISGEGVVIFSGCRLRGAETSIEQGAVIGEEGPVTIDNCQIGPGVRLKGGYFKESVFLKNASMGSGAHVREGTILEEEASGAHTVGFKQTILLPFVTVGSLINFCDCLMAGGTGRKNHSEVGSSYIHFNFTPNQDKATASLMGNVPQGVMLKQNPIFLGGQGGLVGPSRLAFGTVIAAGSIFRKDELRNDRLISAGEGRAINAPQPSGTFRSVKRVLLNNILYIANLHALEQWYRFVRPLFVSEDFSQHLLLGLQEKVSMGISERLKRLGELAEKLRDSAEKLNPLSGGKSSQALVNQHMEFCDRWPELSRTMISIEGQAEAGRFRDAFLENILAEIGKRGSDYLAVIQNLGEEESLLGTRWLQGVVDHVAKNAFDLLPAFSFERD